MEAAIDSAEHGRQRPETVWSATDCGLYLLLPPHEAASFWYESCRKTLFPAYRLQSRPDVHPLLLAAAAIRRRDDVDGYIKVGESDVLAAKFAPTGLASIALAGDRLEWGYPAVGSVRSDQAPISPFPAIPDAMVYKIEDMS
jgi:hypothetical protein